MYIAQTTENDNQLAKTGTKAEMSVSKTVISPEQGLHAITRRIRRASRVCMSRINDCFMQAVWRLGGVAADAIGDFERYCLRIVLNICIIFENNVFTR